jgi:hypothetical protein
MSSRLTFAYRSKPRSRKKPQSSLFSRLSDAEVEERSGVWEGAALPANIDRQLADLERRMDKLEARPW